MKFSCVAFAPILFLANHIVVSRAQTFCPTPELTALESWAEDSREGVVNEGLTPITSGTDCITESSRQKVLVIGVDGLRADAAAMLPLPNFRRLERIGSYSYWASVQSSGTAVSGPGWASLYTGVETSKHKVDGNGDVTDIADEHPTFIKAVKDAFPLKKVAAAVTWHPLVEMIDKQDPSTLDDSLKADNDGQMVDAALTYINSGTYDLIFAAFDTVDAAGHSQGFDGYKQSYITGVTTTDYRIGLLLDAVMARSTGEEWLIVLTTDHGGFGTSHGGQDYYNRRVPFMVASNSPRVALGRAPHDDPGSQMDVLPTVMHFLGGPIPTNLDGQVFGFRDYQRTPPSNTACADSDPDNCGCSEVQQADYRGTEAKTISGRTCQRWDSQLPHDHTNTPANKPLAGLDSNYCRNPDGEDGAWCYTTDPNKRWELCAVQTCGEPTTGPGACPNSNPTQCGCANVEQDDYRGTESTTVSGYKCQRWDAQFPHKHDRTVENYPSSGLTENYCRNPDGEDGAWCYTENPNKRWELCTVPTC